MSPKERDSVLPQGSEAVNPDKMSQLPDQIIKDYMKRARVRGSVEKFRRKYIEPYDFTKGEFRPYSRTESFNESIINHTESLITHDWGILPTALRGKSREVALLLASFAKYPVQETLPYGSYQGLASPISSAFIMRAVADYLVLDDYIGMQRVPLIGNHLLYLTKKVDSLIKQPAATKSA